MVPGRPDMRTLVEKGYDSGTYAEHYRRHDKLNAREKRFFSRLRQLLPRGGEVLDLGSGVGIPYDKHLVSKGFKVTGIDLSAKHVSAARKNVPEATYLKGDFSRVRMARSSYDALVSFYAIFHIPREEHARLFKKMHRIIKPEGIILITLGVNEMEMDVDDFVGAKMAWSSYSARENRKLIAASGFKIFYEEQEHQGSEHHLWILAKKR